MKFDPETDTELRAELENDASAELARERMVGGVMRMVVAAPVIVLGTLPIAILFGSLVIMLIGVVGGVAVAGQGLAMTVRGRRQLRDARERRQLPVATLRN